MSIILYNNRILVNSIDIDVFNFLQSTNLKSMIKIMAVDSLVIGLKTYNLWTKMRVIYPFVSDGINQTREYQHTFNLKDPRDLDIAYRLKFYGGIVHDNNGVTPNGIDSYADTCLNDNTLTLNSKHLSLYSRTNINGGYCDAGVYGSGGATQMFTRFSNLMYYRNGDDGGTENTNCLDSTGLFINNRISSTTRKIYRNGNILDTLNINSTSLCNDNIYLFVQRFRMSFNSRSVRNLSFFSIGDGLSDTDASNLYNIVQTYQTMLNRNV